MTRHCNQQVQKSVVFKSNVCCHFTSLDVYSSFCDAQHNAAVAWGYPRPQRGKFRQCHNNINKLGSSTELFAMMFFTSLGAVVCQVNGTERNRENATSERWMRSSRTLSRCLRHFRSVRVILIALEVAMLIFSVSFQMLWTCTG